MNRWPPHKIIIAILQALAILSTIFRLHRRRRAGQLWWDDLVAATALFFSFFLFATMFLSFFVFRKDHKQMALRGVIQWSAVLLFSTVIWLARMSLSLTIVRLLPHGRRLRKLAWGATAVCFAFLVAVIVQKFVVCGSRDPARIFTCPTPRSTAAIELATDFIADLYLVCLPIYMLVNMGLHSKDRRVILTIFATSLLTSIIGIVHCIFIIRHNGRWMGITAYLEASCSLLLCNLLVILMPIYRAIRDTQNSDSENSTSYPTTSRNDRSLGTTFSDGQDHHHPSEGFVLTTISDTWEVGKSTFDQQHNGSGTEANNGSDHTTPDSDSTPDVTERTGQRLSSVAE